MLNAGHAGTLPIRADRALPLPSATDRYVSLLVFALAGYALLGKGFAYLGVPPVYIGEIVLVLGCAALLRTGCIVSPLTTLPALCILALMVWVLARTVPFVGAHGVDALRDSVVALYGMFTFIVVALLLEKPERLDRAVDQLGFFVRYCLPLAIISYAIARFFYMYMPRLPGSQIEVLALRPGEIGVHLSAGIVFVTLGLGRAGRVWAAFVLACVLLVATQNRGALISILIPVSFAMIVSGRAFRLATFASVIAVALAAAWLVDLHIEFPRGDRPVSAVAVINNIVSTFVPSLTTEVDGTKLWRLRWWDAIRDYTVWGPYFWTGKGFGMNLAVVDGFLVGQELGGPPVRSPHSVHMTFLARAGVPGLLLWWSVCLSWFAMMALNIIEARRRGASEWARLFLFLACYVGAMMINASVDVAFEGPMLGIWLWVIVGLGIGASMIFRAPRSARIPERAAA